MALVCTLPFYRAEVVISWVNYIQAISDWHKPTHPQSLPRRQADLAQGQVLGCQLL